MSEDTNLDQDGWYSDEQATLGDRLAAAREAAGLSQAQLAGRLGVRTRTLRSWESDLAEPRANRLQMLAAMLGVSLRWLLSGEGEGISPPSMQELSAEETREQALNRAMTDLRGLRAEMLALAVRVGQAEKRLRHHVEGSK